MDLSLAIYQINPLAEYRLNDAKTAILEWRGPGPQPTGQQLTDAWAVYQAALPPVPDYGNAIPADQDRRLAETVTNLRTYLDLALPTPTQREAAFKLLIRFVLHIGRRVLG